MAVVSIRLEGQDNASDKIKKVNRSLDDLGKSANKQIDLGNITDQISGLGSAGGVAGALGGVLGKAIPIAGIAIAATQIADTTWELGKLGAEVLRTQQAFNDLAAEAGTSGQSMLMAIRGATQGTVSDMDLMAAANKAMMLGVANDAETMAGLFEAAMIKGQRMGVDATQAVDTLITGIGRMSAETLDNLGIKNIQGQIEAYAASLGTTADKLTDVQKVAALTKATLESVQGLDVAKDAASSFKEMDAAIQNAKGALGVMFSPAIAAIAQNLADAATAATDAMTTDAMEAAQHNLDYFGAELSSLYNKYKDLEALGTLQKLDGNTDQYAATQQQLAMLSTQLKVYAENYNDAARVTKAPLIDVEQIQRGVLAEAAAATGMEQLASSTQVATAAAAGSTLVMEGVRQKLAELAGQAAATGNALRSAWIGAAGALGASQAFAGFQTAQKQLEGLRTEWNYMGLTSEQIAFKEAEFLDNNNGKIQDQIKLIDDATTATQAHGGAVSSVSSAYDELTSKVQGAVQSALQSATSLDPIGVDPGKYLPRADAVQEDAFRLADIMVNGFNSPWVDYFKIQFPKLWDEISSGGDIQAGAAKVLQQFQQGMRPELLNFDQLKETIKQQILGQQAFAGMADQITQQLVGELGVSASQVQGALAGVVGSLPGGQQIASQVGATDMTGTGTSAGDTFMAGFGASVNGGTLVATITTQITAAISQFNTSGRTAGEKWAAGFYTSVETGMAPQLIALLATLVTPGVLAQIQTQQSQTGTQD